MFAAVSFDSSFNHRQPVSPVASSALQKPHDRPGDQEVVEWIGEPTVADAFLDGILSNVHRPELELVGESLRKLRKG
jgi:hypothetical protein